MLTYQSLQTEWARTKFVLPKLPAKSNAAKKIYNELETLDRLGKENLYIRKNLEKRKIDRDAIVQYEKQSDAFSQASTEKQIRNKLVVSKERIYTSSVQAEKRTIDLLKQDLFKKEVNQEIAALKKDIQAKKENNQAAQNDAIEQEIKALEEDLKLLESFLTDINDKDSKMMKTIRAFAQQKARDGLDPSDVLAAEKANQVVAYAEDKHRKQENDPSLKTITRSYFSNGKALEAHFSRTADGLNVNIQLQRMLRDRWGFSKNRWEKKQRKEHIVVAYDELVTENCDGDYSLPGYSDLPETQYQYTDRKEIQAWKRKYLAEFMEYVSEKAEQSLNSVDQRSNNDYVVFKSRFMTFNSAIDTLKKDVLEENRTSRYREELKTIISANNTIHTKNARLAQKNVSQTRRIEARRKTAEFDQINAKKEAVLEAKNLAIMTRDYIAQSLHYYPQNYSTLERFTHHIKWLEQNKRIATEACQSIKDSVERIEKEYQQQSKNLPKGHPDMMALEATLRQGKESLTEAMSALETLTKVIDEVSTVFPPVDYALLFAHIIDNDGQLDVIIELLTQEAQNILRGILINKQPTEPITREDVRQAVSNNRESAMAVLTNAFDRLVKGDPADIQRKSKITRLIAGATHKTDKSLLLTSLNARQQQQTAIASAVQENLRLLGMFVHPDGLLTDENKRVLNQILNRDHNQDITENNIREALKRDPEKTMEQLNIAYDRLIKRDISLADRDQKVASLIHTLPEEKKAALVSLNDATITAAATTLSNHRETARRVIIHDETIKTTVVGMLGQQNNEEHAANILLTNNGYGAGVLAANDACVLKTLEASEAARSSIATDSAAMVSVLRANEPGRRRLANDPRMLGAITRANTEVAADVLARPEHATSAVAVLSVNRGAHLDGILANNEIMNWVAQNSRAYRDELHLEANGNMLAQLTRMSSDCQNILANDIDSFKALILASPAAIRFLRDELLRTERQGQAAVPEDQEELNLFELYDLRSEAEAEAEAEVRQSLERNNDINELYPIARRRQLIALAVQEPVQGENTDHPLSDAMVALNPEIKNQIIERSFQNQERRYYINNTLTNDVKKQALLRSLQSPFSEAMMTHLRDQNVLTQALANSLRQEAANTQNDPINADNVEPAAKLAVVTEILNSAQAQNAIDNIRGVPVDEIDPNNVYPAGSTILQNIANDFLVEEQNLQHATRFSDEVKKSAIEAGLHNGDKVNVINEIKTTNLQVFNQALDASLQQRDALNVVDNNTVMAMLSESLKAEDALGVKGGAFNLVADEGHRRQALIDVVALSDTDAQVKQAVDGLLNLSRPESLAAHEAISKLAEIAQSNDEIQNAFQAILHTGQPLVDTEWDTTPHATTSINNAIKLDPVRALAILDSVHHSAKESLELVVQFINAHPESQTKICEILNTNPIPQVIAQEQIARAKEINPELTAEAIDAAFAYTDPVQIKKAIDAHADANNVMRQHNKKQQETTLKNAKRANRSSDAIVEAESVQKQTDVVKMASGKASPAELFAVKRIVKALHNLNHTTDATVTNEIKAAMVLAHPEGIAELVLNNDEAKQAIATASGVNVDRITEANIVECIQQAYRQNRDDTIAAVAAVPDALVPEKIQQAIDVDPYRAYKNARDYVPVDPNNPNDPVTVAMLKTITSRELSEKVSDVDIKALISAGYNPVSDPFDVLNSTSRNGQLNSDFCRAAILDAKKIALRDQLLLGIGTLEKWPGKEGVRIVYTDGRDAIELSGDDVRAAIPEILRAAEDSAHNILTDNRAMLTLSNQTSTDPDSNGQRLQENLENTKKAHRYAQEASAPLTRLREMIEDKNSVLGQLFVTDEKAIKESEENIKTLAKTETNAKTAYEAAYKVAEESIKNPRHAAYERLKREANSAVSEAILGIRNRGIQEGGFTNDFFPELATLVVNDPKIRPIFSTIVAELQRADSTINVDLTDHASVKEFLERNVDILTRINQNISLLNLLADQEKLVSTIAGVSHALNSSPEVLSAQPFNLARRQERERILRHDPPQAVVDARARAQARGVADNIDNDPEVKKVIDQSITNDMLDKAPAVQAALQKASAANPQVIAAKTRYDQAKKATEKENKHLQHLTSKVPPDLTELRTLEADSKSQQQQSMDDAKKLTENNNRKEFQKNAQTSGQTNTN